MSKPAAIATLGPEESNHGFIAGRYCRARDLRDAEVLYYDDFDAALHVVAAGTADYILICGVHPACGMVVGRGQYEMGLRIVDMFIAASQPLVVLTRADIEHPQSIAFHPATETYTDLSTWDQRIPVSSTVSAAEGVLAGTWHSALTTRRFSRQGGLRVDRELPAPVDPWLVLGKGSGGDPLHIGDRAGGLTLPVQGPGDP